MDRPGMLLAGQIGKPHGISGEVYVVRISDDPARFAPGATLMHSDGRELIVATARSHRNRFLVRFQGVETRSEAESLRGELYIGIEQTRDLEFDEFWPHQLIGCKVITADGVPVGSLSAIRPGAAHDLLVVETSVGERMIPAVKAIVTGIDVERRRITIDPPMGLLD